MNFSGLKIKSDCYLSKELDCTPVYHLVNDNRQELNDWVSDVNYKIIAYGSELGPGKNITVLGNLPAHGRTNNNKAFRFRIMNIQQTRLILEQAAALALMEYTGKEGEGLIFYGYESEQTQKHREKMPQILIDPLADDLKGQHFVTIGFFDKSKPDNNPEQYFKIDFDMTRLRNLFFKYLETFEEVGEPEIQGRSIFIKDKLQQVVSGRAVTFSIHTGAQCI